jgi:SOS-response transcriptional repressor LexA
MGNKIARDLEKELNLPPGWFDLPFTDAERLEVGKMPHYESTTAERVRSVPEVALSDITPSLTTPPVSQDIVRGRVNAPLSHPRGSFATRVVGHAMAGDTGYADGEILIVQPIVSEDDLEQGADVVAYLGGLRRAVFRRFQRDDLHRYLVAVNPDVPDRRITLTPNDTLIGVCVSSIRQRSTNIAQAFGVRTESDRLGGHKTGI